MNDYRRYKSAVGWLEQFDSKTRTKQYMHDRSHPERYIQRMRYFLEQLGCPDRGMKYIHITGTAGKGTVSTIVHHGLWSAGKRAGLFTSPYCITVAENIQVNGRLIAAAEFVRLVDHIRSVVKRVYQNSPFGGPSYFEMLLAIAFLYFKKQKCDWVVLEVGLGGRYDATNVINAPVVSAITTIGLDHTKILGPTLRHIARDKAGIIKPGSAFFTTEHRTTLLNLFHNICHQQGVSFTQLPHLLSAQETNALLARAILEYSSVPSAAIDAGIRQTQLPCRFESVQKNPRIILDGAHNAIKIAALLRQLRSLSYQRLIVVLGMLDDKDLQSIARQIDHSADIVILTHGTHTPMLGRHWASLSVLKSLFFHADAITEKSPLRALRLAQSMARARDVILVTGSFALAGELRAQWYSEKTILHARSSFPHW